MKSQETSNLKAGDVIFVRNDGLISRVIRWITRSKWSHVAVYLGDDWVIDTDLLRRVSIHHISDFKYWEARRYPDITNLQIRHVVEYMVERLDAKYDWLQILGFLIEHTLRFENDWGEPTAYSCGKIIDLAYFSAGIDLVPWLKPGDVTPHDLYISIWLKEV